MRRRAAGEGSMEKSREAKQKKTHKTRGQVEMMRAQEHSIT